MRIGYTLLLFLLLGLAGCAGVSPRPEAGATPEERAAVTAMADGDYLGAAREFTRLATRTPPPLRHEYHLRAVEAMLKGGLLARAAQVLDRLDTEEITLEQRARVRLLRAENALLQHDPERALAALAPPPPGLTRDELWTTFHDLRARAYARLGNHLETAREYVEQSRYIDGAPESLNTNRERIWEALSLLPEQMLGQLAVAAPPDPLAGWVELARLAKDVRLSTQETSLRVSAWRELYPGHPAEVFIDGILQRSEALTVEVRNVALLLPLSGRLARPAAAVRDGVLAAYYASAKGDDFRLRIYDIGENANRVLGSYEQALREGADFVIGPLSKEGVEALMRRGEFPVPTLALNHVPTTQSAMPNFYQFSLSPEEEAEQVAERTWLDGFGHSAVLVPKGEWGERVHQAFAGRWEQLGGSIVAAEAYDTKENDFSRPLMRLLNVDQSKQRHRLLMDTIGQRLEMIERRRQDIDFIFLAGLPRQARLIRPQLRFHHASNIPVYATSHVYSGTEEVDQDRDMDGVIFGDMPWTLDDATPTRGARRESIASLQGYDGQWQRLVALGFDAYNLISLYKVLDQYPHERFQGETGTLHLDEDNRLLRSLRWAQFTGGIPRVIEDGGSWR